MNEAPNTTITIESSIKELREMSFQFLNEDSHGKQLFLFVASELERLDDRVFSLEGVMDAIDRMLEKHHGIHASRALAIQAIVDRLEAEIATLKESRAVAVECEQTNRNEANRLRGRVKDLEKACDILDGASTAASGYISKLEKERDDVSVKVKQLEAQCGEMRELFQKINGFGRSKNGYNDLTFSELADLVNEACEEALSNDCGKGMVSVRELDKTIAVLKHSAAVHWALHSAKGSVHDLANESCKEEWKRLEALQHKARKEGGE